MEVHFQEKFLENDIKYRQKCPKAYFNAIRLVSNGKVMDSFGISEEIKVELEYTVIMDNTKLSVSIHLLDNTGTCILATGNLDSANLGKDTFVNKPLKKVDIKRVASFHPIF